MRQLSGTDSIFLQMETATTHGHVGGLQILDPSSCKGDVWEESRRVLIERLHLTPPYRWRLAEIPLGLDRAYWINDPDFDLGQHLHHIAVPAPGTREQLSELVCDLHARPLDRTRPLWEMYFIDGLENGMVAVYAKSHHAWIDGASGTNMAGLMLDTTPEPRTVPPPAEQWLAEQMPTDVELFARGAIGLASQPVRAARWSYRLWQALPGVSEVLPSLRDLSNALGISKAEDEDVLERPPAQAPRTPFNATISGRRGFAYGTVSLDSIKRIKNSLGATVNDVVLALCAATLRRWLLDHHALPDEPLLSSIPISIRSDDQALDFSNRVSSMITQIPTHLDGPIERVRYSHEQMKGAKERFGALPADILTDAAQFMPPAVAAMASRLTSRTRIMDTLAPPMNLTISNVPGPRDPLYSGGALQVASYPLSIVTDGQGLNMTVVSYRGQLDYGFLVCPELVPDVWTMATYFEEALAELEAAVSESPTRDTATAAREATAQS